MQHYITKIYRTALLFILSLAICTANAAIKIEGKVCDERNSPIEFATVRVAGTALGTTTNNKGDYTLSVSDRDTLMVIFTCIGYSDVKRQFVNPKGTITLNVKMYEKAHTLNELQVTDIKRQTDQMQTISAAASRITPDASGGSIEAVLTTMAGVSSKNEMST